MIFSFGFLVCFFSQPRVINYCHSCWKNFLKINLHSFVSCPHFVFHVILLSSLFVFSRKKNLFCLKSPFLSDASQTNASADSVTISPISEFDPNELTNPSTDIEASSTFNTPSPIVVVLRKKPSTCFNCLDTRHQTHSQRIQYRKSLSESDLLNEIDNALVLSKGFLYSRGKWA